MTPFEEARILFPNMPDEVFRLWFDDRIVAEGWPPQGLRWHGILCQRSVEFWKQLKWKIEDIPINELNNLGLWSRNIVVGLIQANKYNVKNEFSAGIPDSKRRYDSIVEYVVQNHNLPGKLILLDEGNCYQIVDGCHRLSVFFTFARYSDFYNYFPNRLISWVAYNNNKNFG